MNTQSLPALYQIATFGSAFGRQPSHHDRGQSAATPRPDRPQARGSASGLQRSPDFLVQLMVGGDADLRKAIGSRHIAARRENAYGRALAARPSQAGREPDTIEFA